MLSMLPSCRLVQAFTLSVSILMLIACGKQGEGERCDTNNGNSDCESGLVCTPVSDLVRAGEDIGALCCPAEGQASVQACIPQDTSFADAGGQATGGTTGTPDAATAGSAGTATGGSAGSGAAGGAGAAAGSAGVPGTGGAAGTGLDAGPDASGPDASGPDASL